MIEDKFFKNSPDLLEKVSCSDQSLLQLLFERVQIFLQNVQERPASKAIPSDAKLKPKDDSTIYLGTGGFIEMYLRLHRLFGAGVEGNSCKKRLLDLVFKKGVGDKEIARMDFLKMA